MQAAIKLIKDTEPNMIVMPDVALIHIQFMGTTEL